MGMEVVKDWNFQNSNVTTEYVSNTYLSDH